MRALRTTLLALAAVIAAVAAPADAATITIGSPLKADFTGRLQYKGPETVANVTLPGALISSPLEGTVVRWRVLGATGGPFRLRILSANADGTYNGLAASAPQAIPTEGLQTFPTNLPIKAGQTIGIDNTNASPKDVLGAAVSAAAGFAIWDPTLGDGFARAPAVFFGGPEDEPLGAELAFNADVVPRPRIDSVSPASGPIGGGSAVQIAGHDFSGATGVKFGATPAASFSVASDGSIAAVAPPAAIGGVDIAVTTVGGTSAPVAGDLFTYTACVVPKLTGKRLKGARRSLAAAGCKLGKVRGKGKKVVKQGPKPGSVLPPGTEVGVKLAAPPHRRRAG